MWLRESFTGPEGKIWSKKFTRVVWAGKISFKKSQLCICYVCHNFILAFSQLCLLCKILNAKILSGFLEFQTLLYFKKYDANLWNVTYIPHFLECCGCFVFNKTNLFQTVSCKDCKFKSEDCLHMQWILKVWVLYLCFKAYINSDYLRELSKPLIDDKMMYNLRDGFVFVFKEQCM